MSQNKINPIAGTLIIVCDHSDDWDPVFIGNVELSLCKKCLNGGSIKHGMAIRDKTECMNYFHILGEYWEHTPEKHHDIPMLKSRIKPWKRMSDKGKHRSISQGHVYTSTLKELK